MISDENVRKGVEMIDGEITKLLQTYGITEIECKGKPFDPHSHEAIQQVDATNKKERDTVKEVYQKGYKLGDRVIRPARVVVFK